jgi:hypothetical protein
VKRYVELQCTVYLIGRNMIKEFIRIGSFQLSSLPATDKGTNTLVFAMRRDGNGTIYVAFGCRWITSVTLKVGKPLSSFRNRRYLLSETCNWVSLLYLSD